MSTIVLSESNNARIFDKDNLVHRKEFDLVCKWINEKIRSAPVIPDNYKDGFNSERLHDTISVFGTRGSGKSSFLLSLLNYVSNLNDAVILDIIDPTLIEDKGHVFLTIISLIKLKVEKKLAKSDINPESYAFQEKREWENCLRNLASGLPSIDGIGQGYETWQDPEIIMYKGLSSVAAAKSLEADFNKLIKRALEILGKKVFVFTFDDIDIYFQRGWPVLETIRKYLTSPHIVTLISGDLRLFSKAIRKRQWENFGKGLLKNEGELLNTISEYNDLVTEMEGQYLLKVLRTQRRINLTTLLEKMNFSGYSEYPIYIDDGKTTVVEKYCAILKEFGISNTYQATAYSSFLLSLPIRTQIQLLSCFTDNIEKKDLNQIDFISPFISDLLEKRVDIDIAKSNYLYLTSIILKLLIKEKVLSEAYQLQPTTPDLSLNSSLISLSFLFSANTINNPYIIFDYILRIGYIRNLLNDISYRGGNNNKVNNPSIEGLCEHAGIFNSKVLKDVACNITAYIKAVNVFQKYSSKLYSGIIELPGLKIKQKDKNEDKRWRFDDVMQNANPIVRLIAYLPFTISKNKRGQDVPSYSVFVLLASIGELILKVKYNDLPNGILELTQVRSYPMPIFEGVATNDTYEMEMLGGEILSKYDETISRFLEDFKQWEHNYNKITVSPHLLGKISTRFYYSLANIEKEKLKGNNLGQEMHRRIVSLMNAILVEDIKENLNDNKININLNNPDKSSKIFIDNLSKVNLKTKELSFSKWLISCPLLLVFLNLNDEGLKNALPDDEENVSSYRNNVYNTLIQVSLDTEESQKNNSIGKLDSLYYGKNTIDQSIEHLKNNKNLISYENLMNDKIEILIPKLKQIISRNVSSDSITKFRKIIKEKNLKW